MRHMHVVHERCLVCVLACCSGVSHIQVFAGQILSSHRRIVDQELPFEMAAFAVVQVAGFAGVEVSCGIVIDLAVDVTVLEVGIRWHFSQPALLAAET